MARIQTHTNKIENYLLFDGNSGYVNALPYYVVRTLTVVYTGSFEKI